jgi:hypothetical protein
VDKFSGVPVIILAYGIRKRFTSARALAFKFWIYVGRNALKCSHTTRKKLQSKIPFEAQSMGDLHVLMWNLHHGAFAEARS